jgi:5-methylcytosine-specific restriction protein A
MTKGNWPTTSRHERGYGTEWDKLREEVLERDHYLCQCPECKGGEIRVTLATEVHHIKPKGQGGTDDKTNLTSTGHDCHLRMDAEAQGKTLKARVVIGLDGFPVNSGSCAIVAATPGGGGKCMN